MTLQVPPSLPGVGIFASCSTTTPVRRALAEFRMDSIAVFTLVFETLVLVFCPSDETLLTFLDASSIPSVVAMSSFRNLAMAALARISASFRASLMSSGSLKS